LPVGCSFSILIAPSIDLKSLKTYQQVFLYLTPMMTNLGFVNIGVIVVRLRWFRRRFRGVEKKPINTRRDNGQNSRTVADASATRDLGKEKPSETALGR
jgi:hypothetical protein